MNCETVKVEKVKVEKVKGEKVKGEKVKGEKVNEPGGIPSGSYSWLDLRPVLQFTQPSYV